MKKLLRTALYKLNYYKLKKAQPYGLNLGGGSDKIENFLSLDADYKTGCDIVTRVGDLKYSDNSVMYIYNSHTLEHVHRKFLWDTLAEWHRVLKPGGKLYVCVPNVEKLFNIYLANIKDYKKNKSTADLACAIIYGGQKDKWDFHYNGFSFVTLQSILQQVGFKNVKLFQHKDVKMLSHLQDAGNTAKINGENISLNIVAEKI